MSMTARVLVLCVCMLAGTWLLAHDRGPVSVPPRDSLSTLPMEIGPWSGQNMSDLSNDARTMLRVTDYTNRTYVKPDRTSIGLYIGYHAEGGFHSPLNCLPGSGWIPVKTGRIDLPVQLLPEKSGFITSIHINRIVILKGLDKQVVLYWYQGCGRVIASEYWGLIYGMVDKMRLGRTDAALVRITSPATSLEPAAENAAGNNAVDFTRLIFPMLSRYIPN